jgi:hypothetical protein
MNLLSDAGSENPRAWRVYVSYADQVANCGTLLVFFGDTIMEKVRRGVGLYADPLYSPSH